MNINFPQGGDLISINSSDKYILYCTSNGITLVDIHGIYIGHCSLVNTTSAVFYNSCIYIGSAAGLFFLVLDDSIGDCSSELYNFNLPLLSLNIISLDSSFYDIAILSDAGLDYYKIDTTGTADISIPITGYYMLSMGGDFIAIANATSIKYLPKIVLGSIEQTFYTKTTDTGTELLNVIEQIGGQFGPYDYRIDSQLFFAGKKDSDIFIGKKAGDCTAYSICLTFDSASIIAWLTDSVLLMGINGYLSEVEINSKGKLEKITRIFYPNKTYYKSFIDDFAPEDEFEWLIGQFSSLNYNTYTVAKLKATGEFVTTIGTHISASRTAWCLLDNGGIVAGGGSTYSVGDLYYIKPASLGGETIQLDYSAYRALSISYIPDDNAVVIIVDFYAVTPVYQMLIYDIAVDGSTLTFRSSHTIDAYSGSPNIYNIKNRILLCHDVGDPITSGTLDSYSLSGTALLFDKTIYTETSISSSSWPVDIAVFTRDSDIIQLQPGDYVYTVLRDGFVQEEVLYVGIKKIQCVYGKVFILDSEGVKCINMVGEDTLIPVPDNPLLNDMHVILKDSEKCFISYCSDNKRGVIDYAL